LCALNCISIAAWECGLDQAQGKVSIATLHPAIIGRVGAVCLSLAVGSFLLAIVYRLAAAFFVCVGISALLLACLHASPSAKGGRFTNRPLSRNRGINRRSLIGTPDQRTALADLVLLTPLLPLIAIAL
jgi:hypothetical protein